MRQKVIYAVFVLGAAYALYVGAARAFAATSPLDTSSTLLSTTALTAGLLLFGITTSRLSTREGWGIRLSDGRRLPVRGLLLLGQGTGADLRDPSLCERHARLFARGPELFLEDMAGRGDVRVNGGAALGGAPCSLSAGDLVEIAGLLFRVGR